MLQTVNPLVSTIVLSYNHRRFVQETLEAVKAQTYKNTQLIIVDDCSTDDSVSIIENWLRQNSIHCTFIRHHKNQGICKSLNDALAVATGKYISMVASDDVWLPDKIAQQVGIMERQPEEVGVIYSEAFQMDADGHLLPSTLIAANWNMPEMPQGQVLDALFLGNFIPGLTTLIRRSCYDKVGLYDESLPWEDWDMWMRIARHYLFVYSPTPSAKYRIHEKSLSHSDPARMLKDLCKICLKHVHQAHLTEHQKSILTETLLNLAGQLYQRNDKEASDILRTLWRATQDKRVRQMYGFARLGFSFRNWQLANRVRDIIRVRFWHPVLNATRPVRNALGLRQESVKSALEK